VFFLICFVLALLWLTLWTTPWPWNAKSAAADAG